MTTSKKPKVILAGWYGATNIGDELLLDVIGGWLRDFDCELVIVSLNPDHTRKTFSCEAVDFHNLGAIAQAMTDADLFVMGGGGIFQDHHPFSIEALYDPVTPDIAQYARPFYMARQFGVKTAICAHGIGPITTKPAREIVADIFSKVDFVSVRDEKSAKLLKSLGVEREVVVAPDPGWLIDVNSQTSVPIPESFESVEKSRRRLGLIIREWPEETQWNVKLLAALNQSLPADWECLWIGFQNAVDEQYVVSDRPFLERMSYFLDRRIESSIAAPASIEETVGEIMSCDAVLSMRLHGGIITISAGKPVGFIEYDDKVVAANNAINVPSSLRLALSDSVEDFTKVITHLIESADDGWQAEPNRLEELRNSALQHKEVLREATQSLNTNEMPRRWSSLDYDWLGGWIQSLIWREREAQKRSTYAHSILQYRDVQLSELNKKISDLEVEANTLRQNIRQLENREVGNSSEN
ncbi:polysaccharide pyruvyl transferase family protein [Brucella intermedia]|uniref:polysaccharide pyruvyl transferase family protein n=1 Tax=Brucella intermedia TaxID=94625 RepID=UPI00165D21D4|nr:polysaccharide pyruvyl transferase family protein [Brucella intermedia]QNQ41344.1 polysaccharide pyruvyl transferase family protein [Brucella intermedia]